MDETKLQELASSSESPAPITTEQQAETPSPAPPAQADSNPPSVHVPERQPGVYAPVTVDAPGGAESQLSDLAAFLKRTWRVWAIIVGVAVGLIVAIVALQSFSEWARNARLKRYDRAVASLTPDRLIARCGQPEEDISKEVFPVVLRTVHYKPWIGEPLVFTFSKTAEQRGDWVFLTMTTENGAKSFDTAESKISAFSCLDSTK